MDGGAVLNFTLTEVPRAYRRLIEDTGAGDDPFDQVVLHQANKFMIDALQKKLGLPNHKVPRQYELIGNTVSSTIPFVLAGLMDGEGLRGGTRIAAIGFGVGLSWAAATITI
jgi:3-oxoacyl-[acyl-carrier-protein] synthase-3